MRIIVTLVIIFLAGFAHAEKRHAGAHVHGLNHVQIVLDGTTLQVNYEFPIAQLQEHDEHKHNEHKPDEHKHDEHKHDEHKHDEHKHDEHKHDEHKHDEHKHDEHKHDEHKHDGHKGDGDHAHLTEELKEIASIFEFVRLPDSAECVQKKINQSLRDVVSDGGASKDSGHKDVVIEANLTCGHPNKITAFDFGPAFERFDDLEKIEVEGVVGDRSLSDSLTRERVKTSI